MTPLECGIIFGGIPAGAISRKGGLIWGIPGYSVALKKGTSWRGDVKLLIIDDDPEAVESIELLLA